MIADAWMENINRQCSAYLSAILDNEKLYFNDLRNETQKPQCENWYFCLPGSHEGYMTSRILVLKII